MLKILQAPRKGGFPSCHVGMSWHEPSRGEHTVWFQEKGGAHVGTLGPFPFHLRWVSPRARVLHDISYFYNYFSLFIKGEDMTATVPSLTVLWPVSRITEVRTWMRPPPKVRAWGHPFASEVRTWG